MRQGVGPLGRYSSGSYGKIRRRSRGNRAVYCLDGAFWRGWGDAGGEVR